MDVNKIEEGKTMSQISEYQDEELNRFLRDELAISVIADMMGDAIVEACKAEENNDAAALAFWEEKVSLYSDERLKVYGGDEDIKEKCINVYAPILKERFEKSKAENSVNDLKKPLSTKTKAKRLTKAQKTKAKRLTKAQKAEAKRIADEVMEMIKFNHTAESQGTSPETQAWLEGMVEHNNRMATDEEYRKKHASNLW